MGFLSNVAPSVKELKTHAEEILNFTAKIYRYFEKNKILLQKSIGHKETFCS